MEREKIEKFKQLVFDFYRENRKDLPWRETFDPYEILVSEIMLQQTQIARVIPKYEVWLKTFPDVARLANASQPEVLKLWSGLGYNRRALALHSLAKHVHAELDSKLPLDVDILRKLPGIGSYTAGAVYTFSTNKPSIFIETNIRTAFFYYFFKDEEVIHDAVLIPLLEATMDAKNPREWYYALMDYGSWVKKTHGNFNRKSKTYTKQSRFAGSKRQLRGQILNHLHSNNHVGVDAVVKNFQRNREEVEEVLEGLVREGFLEYSAGTFRLKK